MDGIPKVRHLADVIEDLDAVELLQGCWRDEVLTLGGRLRPLFGNDVAIDPTAGGYAVTVGGGLIVTLQCPGAAERATVRARCLICPLSTSEPGLWQFALRESARIRLARLVHTDGALWADYELPLAAAHGPILQTVVTVVADAARALRAELAAVEHVSDWRSAA